MKPETKEKVSVAAHEVGEKIKDFASHLGAALNGAADSIGFTSPVARSPYLSAGAALGVGYVLGGGLFTPTTLRILRIGGKLSTVPAIRQLIMNLAHEPR